MRNDWKCIWRKHHCGVPGLFSLCSMNWIYSAPVLGGSFSNYQCCQFHLQSKKLGCTIGSSIAACNHLNTLFFFFFFFDWVGSSLLRTGFLQLRQAGAILHCSAWASPCSCFSCCGARALGTRASVVVGLVAPQHVGSSRTRAQNRVPCIGRWILNHCATREVLKHHFSCSRKCKHSWIDPLQIFSNNSTKDERRWDISK